MTFSFNAHYNNNNVIPSSVACNLQCSYNDYALLVCSVIALVSLSKALHVSFTSDSF